jgi:hypothetical protein
MYLTDIILNLNLLIYIIVCINGHKKNQLMYYLYVLYL